MVQSPRKDPRMCFTRSGQRPMRSAGRERRRRAKKWKRGEWREGWRNVLQILRPPDECTPLPVRDVT